MSEPFVGEIRVWGCNFAPRGWAFCNGGLLPIAENTTLYSVIGTIYGGDGRTSMGLPNLQGRAPMHWGTGPGLSPHNAGELSGVITVPLNETQIPNHDHIVTGVRSSGTSATPSSDLFMGVDRGNSGDNILYLSDTETPNTQLASQALSTAGGTEGHENMQPYLTMNFCIALDGLYPSRN